MFSRFFLVSLLSYAALIASAAYTPSSPFTRNILARQTEDPACTDQCAAYFADNLNQCNNTVVKDTATCFTCNVQHGALTQDSAQQTINAFVESCKEGGQPVNNITISATGSASTNAGGATHTTEPAEEPTSTEPGDGDDPSQTDAAGDPASASANATDSASASGPSAGASSAERMKCRSATVITAVVVILSVVVGSA